MTWRKILSISVRCRHPCSCVRPGPLPTSMFMCTSRPISMDKCGRSNIRNAESRKEFPTAFACVAYVSQFNLFFQFPTVFMGRPTSTTPSYFVWTPHPHPHPPTPFFFEDTILFFFILDSVFWWFSLSLFYVFWFPHPCMFFSVCLFFFFLYIFIFLLSFFPFSSFPFSSFRSFRFFFVHIFSSFFFSFFKFVIFSLQYRSFFHFSSERSSATTHRGMRSISSQVLMAGCWWFVLRCCWYNDVVGLSECGSEFERGERVEGICHIVSLCIQSHNDTVVFHSVFSHKSMCLSMWCIQSNNDTVVFHSAFSA